MSVRAAAIKLTIFLAVTSLITAGLFVVVGDLRFGPSKTYTALFSTASGVTTGDDVKVAGVPVGTVESVEFADHSDSVAVTFSMNDDIDVRESATAAIKYKNLIGDRYVEVATTVDNSALRSESDPIPLEQTTPALDVDALVNGFKPLLQGLNPEQTNQLSASIVEVLNGRQQDLGTLITQIGDLGSAVGERDAVIGQVVDDLNTVLGSIDDRDQQFDEMIVRLQSVVSGLSADRDTLTRSLQQIDDASTQTADLLAENRPSIAQDVTGLSGLTSNLNADSDTLSLLLNKLPETYRLIGRASGYGSFVNFFVCGLAIRYPTLGGHEDTPMFTSPAERCK